MEEDFGSLLYKNLFNILNSTATEESQNDQEDTLYQLNCLDELLTIINNVSNSLEVNILEEDRENLLNISNAFDQLRKELLHSQSRHSIDATKCIILERYVAKTGQHGRPKIIIEKEVLEELRGLGFSWVKIAKMLNVSR